MASKTSTIASVRRGLIKYLYEKGVSCSSDGRSISLASNAILGEEYNKTVPNPLIFGRKSFGKVFEFMAIKKSIAVKSKSERIAKYHEYLKSPEWEIVRQMMFRLRGEKCELCGSESFIQVHHLHYQNIFDERPDDLQVVCRSCHKKIHGIEAKPKKNKNNEYIAEVKRMEAEIKALKLKLARYKLGFSIKGKNESL